MGLLIVGLLVFIGIHLLPSARPLRETLAARLGAGRYRAAFSLVSLAGLILIVVGMASAEYQPLWNPLGWGARAALVLMIPAMILLPAANMPTNIKRFTRHPMLWGVTLWALAHLLANGDLASLVLFGSLGIFALADMASANLRGAQLAATRYPLKKDIIVVAAGLFTYVLLVFLHPYLFGAPAFRGF